MKSWIAWCIWTQLPRPNMRVEAKLLWNLNKCFGNNNMLDFCIDAFVPSENDCWSCWFQRFQNVRIWGCGQMNIWQYGGIFVGMKLIVQTQLTDQVKTLDLRLDAAFSKIVPHTFDLVQMYINFYSNFHERVWSINTGINGFRRYLFIYLFFIHLFS